MSEQRVRMRLGEALEVAMSEERRARGWHRVAVRAYGTPRVVERAHWAARVGLVAAAAVLLLVILRPATPSERGPLVVRGGGASMEAALRAASAEGETVALDDGSFIAVDAGSELLSLENDGDRFSLLLRTGRASFDVRPGGGRRWTIEAGLVSVEVVGTTFEVVRDARGVRVAVERGRLLVRGDAVPDRVRSLGAGESIRIDAGTASAERAEAPEVESAPVSARIEAGADEARGDEAVLGVTATGGEQDGARAIMSVAVGTSRVRTRSGPS